MLSPVSPHLLVPLLPLGTAPSTLVLGLAPGPRKYIQRFFDMKGIPEQGVKPPETLYPSIPTGLGFGGRGEKTQLHWAGIEPWTYWPPCQHAFNVRTPRPIRTYHANLPYHWGEPCLAHPPLG